MASASAVFEERRGIQLDDTIPLSCSFDEPKVEGSHITYLVRVQRGWSKDDTWGITRRYSDFVKLHSELAVSGLDLPLPPKKVFGNMDRMFIAERKAALQVYLECVLREPVLTCQLCVKRFLDPENYDVSMDEEALRQVSMFFRNEPTWEVVERLPNIGWRIRRHYYIVRPRDSPKAVKHMLTLLPPGPQLFLAEKDLTSFFKVLSSLIHPHILPVQFSTWNNSAALLIQPFLEQGSLRDCMNPKIKLRQPFVRKYACGGHGLSLMEIRKYGRQVLDAVKYLHDKQVPFTNFHAGNIFVDGGNVKLTGIEVTGLGLPSCYRHYIITLKKIQTKDAEAAYSFGHLLYEMTFGEMLKLPCVEQIPAVCHPELKPVLESLVTSAGTKSGLPSLSTLLASPVFPELPTALMDAKPQFKVGSKLKESLRVAKESAEGQLQDEQKKVSQLRRINTAKEKEKAISEEERRKRAKAKKKSLVTAASTEAAPRSKSPKREKDAPAAAAAAPAAPPAPPAPPAPAPAPPAPAPAPPSGGSGRGDLLSSISGFSKGGLKKADTNDRSGPTV